MSRQPSKRRPPAKRSTSKAKGKATPAGSRKASASKAKKPVAARTQPIAAVAPVAATGLVTNGGDAQWTFRNQFKRINLKDRPTQIALGAIALVMVLVAVVVAWPGSSTSSKLAQQAAAEAEASIVDDLSTGKGKTVKGGSNPIGAAVDVPEDEFQENPFSDEDFAKQVAAQIKPQSTDFPNGNPVTWAGVDRKNIKAVFSYDRANCGINLINAISAAGAQFGTSTRYYQAAPKNNETSVKHTIESVNTLVKVFNRRGFEAGTDFPQLKPLLEKFGSPDGPFYGRKLIHEFVDGGSFQCPDTTTAAAIEIAQEIKPYVVFNNFDGASYNMAEALAAKAPADRRPMHFGTLWLSDKDYNRWHPFNWTQFNSGTRGAELYSSYVCSQLVGKKAAFAPDYKDTTRKWALLYPNLPSAKHVADELKALVIKHCGKNIYEGNEIAYAPDPSRAADEGSTVAIRLKLAGVTSLTYVQDPVFPIFQMVEFQSQDYQPEFVWTPSGYYDSSTVQRIYQSLAVDYYVTSLGVTQFGVPGGFGFTAGDPFWAWHDTHKTSPKTKKACDPSSDAGMNHDEEYCKAPGAIVTWYYTTLPLLAGIIFSGPDLNPKFVTQGLQAYPPIRYGIAGPTDSPHPALLGSGPGKHSFIVDGLAYRWRGDYISPPPEGKIGWVHYQDCERHYIEWPNGLARNWEKNGPNYNSFCGDAKYAPKPYRPTAPGNSCADDAPGGVCKNDGYPRWQSWEQG